MHPMRVRRNGLQWMLRCYEGLTLQAHVCDPWRPRRVLARGPRGNSCLPADNPRSALQRIKKDLRRHKCYLFKYTRIHKDVSLDKTFICRKNANALRHHRQFFVRHKRVQSSKRAEVRGIEISLNSKKRQLCVFCAGLVFNAFSNTQLYL